MRPANLKDITETLLAREIRRVYPDVDPEKLWGDFNRTLGALFGEAMATNGGSENLRHVTTVDADIFDRMADGDLLSGRAIVFAQALEGYAYEIRRAPLRPGHPPKDLSRFAQDINEQHSTRAYVHRRQLERAARINAYRSKRDQSSASGAATPTGSDESSAPDSRSSGS